MCIRYYVIEYILYKHTIGLAMLILNTSAITANVIVRVWLNGKTNSVL